MAAVLFAVAVPSHARRLSAWVPSWDANALTSMQLNAGKLDEANPGWYTIAADGTFTKNGNAEDPALRAALAGVDLMPTIKNYVNGRFDGTMVAAIVGSADLRAKHADALTNLVVQNAFAGIDVDYESLASTTRAGYTLFVQQLAQKLHAAGKKLSVTVSAKTSDAANWAGPAGEDWAAIGAAADSVKIMVYDEHWNGSAAGPIASLSWLDAVATYALSSMPAQKIMIGLPWYGYDWQGTSAATVTYADAMARAQSNGAQIGHDANGEATFSYSGHTVYFQDASSYAAKIDAIVAKHPSIGGFAHWRAGAEDPAIWAKVASLHGGSSSAPAAPAAADFVISGPAALSVRAGQQASASYALTAINGFNSTATVTAQAIDPLAGSISVTPTASIDSAATLNVAPAIGTAAGSYRIRLRMTSGSTAHDVTVTIDVQPPASKRRAAHH